MKRLFAAGLAVTLIGGASYFLTRKPTVFSGPVSNPTAIADICDVMPSLRGPSAFCMRPDGGAALTQTDGGTALSVSAVGSPTAATRTRLPCGDNGCTVSGRATDGNDGFATPNASMSQTDWTACWFGQLNTLASPMLIAHDTNTAGNRAFEFSVTTAGTPAPYVYVTAGSGSAINAAAGAVTSGAPTLACVSYHYVGSGTSVGKVFINGVQSGATTTNLDGPVSAAAATPTTCNHRTYPGANQFANAFTQGCFMSEELFSDAQHIAMAQNLGVYAPTTLQGSFGESLTFTRASAATCVDSTGQSMTVLASGRPCVTGGGYLSEPAGTNLQKYSDALDNVEWTPYGVTAAAPTRTANAAVALDGTLTAETFAFPAVANNSGDASAFYSVGAATTVAAYTGSIYLKRTAGAGSTVWLWFQQNGSEAVKGTPVACTVGDTWSRCSVTATLAAATTRMLVGCVVGTGCTGITALTVAATGAQTELGSIATSYAPTGATAVTRAVTGLTVANPLYGRNPSAWCIGATVLPTGGVWLGDNSIPGVIALGNSAVANSGSLFVDTSGLVTLDVRDAAGAYLRAKATSLTLSATSAHTVYGCANSGTLSLWADGSPVAATISSPGGGGTGIIATQAATAIIGSVSTGQTMLNGTISNVKILDRGTP
jgi:hypothetical protein